MIYGFLLFAGLISFLVSGAVFTSRFVGNTYDQDLLTYSSLVRGWTANGVPGPNQGTVFAGRYSYPNASSTLSAQLIVTASTDVGAGGSTGGLMQLVGLPDSPAMEATSAIPSYPNAQRVRMSGSLNVVGGATGPTIAWPSGFPRIDGQITLNDASSTNAVSIKLPLAFSYKFDPYCVTVGKVTVCNCPIGTETGTFCIAYYQLKGVCLTVDPADVAALKLGLVPKTLGPGCAPLPRIEYLNQNIPVPQIDDCYALGSSGVSIGAYEYIGGSQPGSISLPILPVTVRSQADPYCNGMAWTGGTGNLPQSTSYQEAVAVSMWALFGIWFLFTFLFLSIGCRVCNMCSRAAVKAWDTTYSPIAEALCCPMLFCARFHAWMLAPMQNCCCNNSGNAAMAARLRTRSRYGLGCSCTSACEDCREGIDVDGDCCKDCTTVLAFPLYILWMIFAGLALTINVNQYCAQKTLCNGLTMELTCFKIGDMLSAGPTAKTFYALQASGFAISHMFIAGIVILWIMVMLSFFVCNRSQGESFFQCAKWIVVGLIPFGLVAGFCITAAAGIYYYQNYTTIGNDYAASLNAIGIHPTAVTPTFFPKTSFPLSILFFFLFILCIATLGCAHYCRCRFRIPCICAACIGSSGGRRGDNRRVLGREDLLAALAAGPATPGTTPRRGSAREAAIRAVVEGLAARAQRQRDLEAGGAGGNNNDNDDGLDLDTSPASNMRNPMESSAAGSPPGIVVTGTQGRHHYQATSTTTTTTSSSVVLDEQNQPVADADRIPPAGGREVHRAGTTGGI
jgi:hypothetical protein